MTNEIQNVLLELIDDHPDNPRLFLREDVINGIVAQIEERGYDPSHAILVRPLNGRFQIVRGHQRKAAATKAGLDTVPCWVREMPDDEAYWELGLSNAQGELTPLEIGRHALGIEDGQAGRGKKGGLSDYARQMGKSQSYISELRQAAEVYHKIKSIAQAIYFQDKAKHLLAIHSLSQGLWPILANWVITPNSKGKTPTVKGTETIVKELLKFNIPILWQAIFLPLTEITESYLETEIPKPKDVAELIIEANFLKENILTLQREFKFNVGLFPFTVQGLYDWLRDGKGTYSWDIKELRKYHQQVREAAEKARELPISDCKQGEWYQLGKHLLYCGDTSKSEFWQNIPDAAFAFADPPYNAESDDWDKDFIWGHDWLIDKAPIVAVTPGIGSIQRFFSEFTEMPYIWSMAAWITNGMTRGALGFGNWIFVSLFSKEKIWRQAQDIVPIECTINISDKRTEHRGRKPPELMRRLFELFSKPGDIIIDPFLGSGTTLFEAERMGRICIGGEINPKFCNDIIGGWQERTGQLAKQMEINEKDTL